MRIESENEIRNETERMERKLEKEILRLQTKEDEKLKDMEYNLKEEFNAKYNLLANEFELKQKEVEKKQKRKWRKYKREQEIIAANKMEKKRTFFQCGLCAVADDVDVVNKSNRNNYSYDLSTSTSDGSDNKGQF